MSNVQIRDEQAEMDHLKENGLDVTVIFTPDELALDNEDLLKLIDRKLGLLRLRLQVALHIGPVH